MNKEGRGGRLLHEGIYLPLRSGHPIQYLNKINYLQNPSSTTGEPEFVAQKFFEIPASVNGGKGVGNGEQRSHVTFAKYKRLEATYVDLLTINVPVVFMARYIMILWRAISITRAHLF
jgi:hypothetical protein